MRKIELKKNEHKNKSQTDGQTDIYIDERAQLAKGSLFYNKKDKEMKRNVVKLANHNNNINNKNKIKHYEVLLELDMFFFCSLLPFLYHTFLPLS